MKTDADLSSRLALLPERSRPPRLIVCERTGQWAAAIGRLLGAAGPRVLETRSLAECWGTLRARPASFVILELTRGNFGPLLDGLAWFGRELPLAAAAVVAERSLAASEWIVREAGAIHFVTSPRSVEGLARAARRHLQQAPRLRPSLAEQIWARLPWGRWGETERGADFDTNEETT